MIRTKIGIRLKRIVLLGALLAVSITLTAKQNDDDFLFTLDSPDSLCTIAFRGMADSGRCALHLLRRRLRKQDPGAGGASAQGMPGAHGDRAEHQQDPWQHGTIRGLLYPLG